MTIDPDATAPVECIEVRSTKITIGRPLVDEVTLEASIAVWDHVKRTFRVNLRIGDDVIELSPHRTQDAAEEIRRFADVVATLGGVAETLTRLEADTTALLGGRARTVAV